MREEEERSGKSQLVLIPRAKIGSEELIRPLEEAGLQYEDLAVYETEEAAGPEFDWYDESVDYVAFTSASTVRGFVKIAKDLDYTGVKALCIGEQTAQEARKYGMRTFVAEEASIDSMVEFLLRTVQNGI